MKKFYSVLLLGGMCVSLLGCEGTGERKKVHTALTKAERDDIKHPERFFGEPLFSTKKNKPKDEAALGVNAHLWRASLDTFSFMPLKTVDPFGGVIITEWHSPAGSAQERFRANVAILGPRLRVDGVRVALFQQQKNAAGEWVDVAVDPAVTDQLEKTVLTRARELKHQDKSAS